MRIFIILLILCNAVIFFAALISSAPPPAVNVAVLGAASVPPTSSPWTARISAVLVDGRGAAEVEGSVKGNDGAQLKQGILTIPFTQPGQQPFNLNLGIAYEAHVYVDCEFGVTSPGAMKDSTPPPLVRPRQVTPPTIIGAREATLVFAGAPLFDGGTGFSVDYTAPTDQRVAVDLLIDGTPREVRVVDVVAGANRIPFAMPTEVAAGALVVVHVASVWPLSRGPWVAGRVGAGPVDLGADEPVHLRPEPLLSCRQSPAPSASDGLRFTYEAVSVLITLMFAATILRGARKDNARGIALAIGMVVVVAAAFAGLDLVLRLGLGLQH